jgi:hypothetical protein
MHLFRKLRIYTSIKNNLIFSVVVINVQWSQNRVIFVVFGPDRLYSYSLSRAHPAYVHTAKTSIFTLII